MHFSSLQMLLLAVVAIMSTPRSALGQVVTPKTCAEADRGLQFCSSCTAPSKCVTAGPAVLMTACKTGQACTVLLGKYAVCKPFNATSCDCGVKPAKCDPYDPHSVFDCLSGGVTAGQQCRSDAVPTGTCIDGKCGTAPPEPTTVSPDDLCKEVEFGLVAVTPQCKTAVFCEDFVSSGTTEQCGEGQYYDLDAVECLPAPPLHCPVACGTGACYDKGNCSKWYICDAGTVLAEETCEGSTPVFDTISLECVENGTCTTNDGCNFALITTLTSTTSTQTPSPTTTTSTITVPISPTTTSTKTSTTPPATTTSTKTSTTPPTTTTSTKTSTTPPTTTTSTKTSTTPPTTTTSTKTSTTPPTTTTSTKTSTTPPTTSSSTTSTKTSTTPITSSSTSTTSTSTTTTNRPSTCGAANVGLRYPFEGNCKKYISCRLVNTNVYGYVESSCLGTLVFNAKTGYCDTLVNVPGCVPPV